MHRIVCSIAALALLCTGAIFAQTAPIATTLIGAHVGLYAIDLSNGAVLANRHADDAFIPASTMKLIVGSAALHRFPAGFAFTTRAWLLGTHLYLQGGGDPTFDDAALAAAATAVAAAGVRAIDAITIDDTRYTGPHYPPGWSIDDMPYDYAAPITAFSLDDNVMHLEFAPAARVGEPARGIGPADAPLVLGATTLVTGAPGSADTSDLRRRWGHARLEAFGSIPQDGPPVTLDAAVQQPREFAYARLREALVERGVTVAGTGPAPGSVPAGARLLWTHVSPPLAQIMARFWLPSDNFYGEMLVNELGTATRGAGSTLDRGIDAERTWLAGIDVDPQSLTIVDGSGLSEYDRATPRALVAILAHDWAGPHRSDVLAALPQAGVRGTLQSAFVDTPLRGILYAKTGSMNHTRTLAGYLITPARSVAFALMINDWMDASPGAAIALDRARAAMLEALLSIPAH